MMKYEITLGSRWGSRVFNVEAVDFEEALKKCNTLTLFDDDTGYFAETEFADPEWVKACGYPVFLDDCGVEVVPVEIVKVKVSD